MNLVEIALDIISKVARTQDRSTSFDVLNQAIAEAVKTHSIDEVILRQEIFDIGDRVAKDVHPLILA